MKQPIPKFYGKTKKTGRLEMSDHERAYLRRYVQSFKEDTDVDIIIKKHSEKRTNKQNRYYWGTVIPILADYFGHDNAEDMHNDLKEKFIPLIESKIQPGKMIAGSTTKLSTIEFFSAEDSYVEKICRWAAVEYGIAIPPPKRVE